MNGISSYTRVRAEGAFSKELLSMLFEQLSTDIYVSEKAIETHRIMLKNKTISHASQIAFISIMFFEEEKDPILYDILMQHYKLLQVLLVRANAYNDTNALHQCEEEARH
jgi:flagellin-specific chaperone FliS